MTINAKLAEKVLDQIELYPETHDQHQWIEDGWASDKFTPADFQALCKNGLDCGTTACIAGHASLLAKNAQHHAQVDNGTVYVNWERAGQVALGLSDDEACWLFYEMNNDEAIYKLRGLAKGLTPAEIDPESFARLAALDDFVEDIDEC